MFIHSKLKHKTLPVKSSVPVINGSITIFWILWSKVTGIGLRELYFKWRKPAKHCIQIIVKTEKSVILMAKGPVGLIVNCNSCKATLAPSRK